MFKHTVPSTPGSDFGVSNPIPDMLDGYNCFTAFPRPQAQISSMGNEPMANTEGLIYPFLVVEFKGSGGDLWVATNQCLGYAALDLLLPQGRHQTDFEHDRGSVSCVNVAERLNKQLKKCEGDKAKVIDSTAFSIAINGTEARLYVSWKHNDLDYYMQTVESFLLRKPGQYIEFRKYVRNIIDWGEDKRLEGSRPRWTRSCR